MKTSSRNLLISATGIYFILAMGMYEFYSSWFAFFAGLGLGLTGIMFGLIYPDIELTQEQNDKFWKSDKGILSGFLISNISSALIIFNIMSAIKNSAIAAYNNGTSTSPTPSDLSIAIPVFFLLMYGIVTLGLLDAMEHLDVEITCSVVMAFILIAILVAGHTFFQNISISLPVTIVIVGGILILLGILLEGGREPSSEDKYM